MYTARMKLRCMDHESHDIEQHKVAQHGREAAWLTSPPTDTNSYQQYLIHILLLH